MRRLLAPLLLVTTPALSQPMDHDMAGMKMDHHGEAPLSAEGSGTSRVPSAEGAMHDAMGEGWMLMAHGFAWGIHSDQSGPRGGRKTYAQSMAMLTAAHDTGWGRIQLKSMFSLEPLMRHDGYPSLFATGEAAYGHPLVDRQHPHDLAMELAARIDADIAPDTQLFVYGGPVGEPALGPSAFMHRASAAYDPEAPIAHHWFDSTHISYGVATLGLASRHWQLEGSIFTGREPDEHRWNIERPRLDSWSARLSWAPSAHWAAQISHGLLRTPEAQHGGEDEHRTTASVHYARDGLSAMLGFAARNRDPGPTLTAWLAEANWNLDTHHSLFGRIENARNDELFPDPADPFHDRPFRVTKLQGGYAYRLKPSDALDLALGGSVAAYLKPDALEAAYGSTPTGWTLFAKLSFGH